MQYNSLFIVGTLTLFLAACGPSVYFEVPQPEGAKPLSEFPAVLAGKYLLEGDTITISELYFETPDEQRHVLPIATVSKSEKIRIGDSVLFDAENLYPGKPLGYEIEDTNIVYFRDALARYYLSDTLVLKRHKKNYFVNMKLNKYWTVCLLKPRWKDELLVLQIRNLKDGHEKETADPIPFKNPNNIDYYFPITPFARIDSTEDYIISPGGKELNKLIKADFFADTLWVLKRL